MSAPGSPPVPSTPGSGSTIAMVTLSAVSMKGSASCTARAATWLPSQATITVLPRLAPVQPAGTISTGRPELNSVPSSTASAISPSTPGPPAGPTTLMSECRAERAAVSDRPVAIEDAQRASLPAPAASIFAATWAASACASSRDRSMAEKSTAISAPGMA